MQTTIDNADKLFEEENSQSETTETAIRAPETRDDIAQNEYYKRLAEAEQTAIKLGQFVRNIGPQFDLAVAKATAEQFKTIADAISADDAVYFQKAVDELLQKNGEIVDHICEFNRKQQRHQFVLGNAIAFFSSVCSGYVILQLLTHNYLYSISAAIAIVIVAGYAHYKNY